MSDNAASIKFKRTDDQRLAEVSRHVTGTPSVYGGTRVPHFEQFMDFWAMPQQHFDQMAAMISAVDPAVHLAETRAERRERTEAGRAATTVRDDAEMDAAGFTLLAGGVAVIDLVGVMTKYGGSFFAMPGGLIGLQRTLRGALAEPQVTSAVLRIDSPGGNVAGTGDLTETVRAFGQKKPIVAFIEDLGASAAYYAATGATQIMATKDSLIGSIGVFMVIDDWSAFFAREGVKRRVLKYGEHKGDGVQGTEITEKQLSDFQRTVDEIGGQFVAAVAKGRKMSTEQAAGLADGRIHIAESAKALGLIDQVGTLEEAIAAARSMVEANAQTPKRGNTGTTRNAAGGSQSLTMKEKSMSAETAPAENAATLQQLKKAIPDSTPSFRETMVLGEATLADAQEHWAEELRRQVKAQGEEIEKLKAAAAAETEKAKAAAKKPGVAPAGASTTSHTSGDSIEEWNDAVAAQMSAGKMTRDVAIREVNRRRPGLREAMLKEYNVKHERPRAAANI